MEYLDYDNKEPDQISQKYMLRMKTHKIEVILQYS